MSQKQFFFYSAVNLLFFLHTHEGRRVLAISYSWVPQNICKRIEIVREEDSPYSPHLSFYGTQKDYEIDCPKAMEHKDTYCIYFCILVRRFNYYDSVPHGRFHVAQKLDLFYVCKNIFQFFKETFSLT